MSLNKYFQKIYNKQNLSLSEARNAFDIIMSGKASNIEIAAFLVSLSHKGVSGDELLSAVKVLRSKSLKINIKGNIIDTCGTGGDKKNTLNISTATAILSSACGLKIAKHGNKSVSSKSGSSEVLEKLGVNINTPVKNSEKLLKNINLCFLMAPMYHNAMKNVAEVRKTLKIPTIFNILGPLLNPAGAKLQLIGVYSKYWMLPIANCLKSLDIKKAWIVHGQDGLDEITTTTKTDVLEVTNKKIRKFQINPISLNLRKAKLKDIKGKDIKHNANQIKLLLENKNENIYFKEIVLLNTAAILVISEKCKNLKDGLKVAKEHLNNGDALKKLQDLKQLSK